MRSPSNESAIPALIIVMMLVVVAVFSGPSLGQNFADQERASIRKELIAHNSRVDPRSSCAGLEGEELQNLAVAEGYCKGLQAPDYKPRVLQELRPPSEIAFSQAYVPPPKRIVAGAICDPSKFTGEGAMDLCKAQQARRSAWETDVKK